MANGRCRLHGGLTPSGPDSAHFKHGRYAKVFQGKLAEKFEDASADMEPLDLLPELAIQRSLLAQYLEKSTGKARLTNADMENISSLAQDVVKTATLIARMRNDEALTANEIKFLQAGILRLLEKYVPDPHTRTNFVRELARVIPERITARGNEPAELPAGTG